MQYFIFTESLIKSEDEIIFEQTELGKLRQVLPIKELASLLPSKKNKSGAKPWLDDEGQIALMFLKHYTGFSDADLIEHLNDNFAMQMFCGIRLSKFERIHDKNLPSNIRCRLSKYLNLEEFQKVCLTSWRDELQDVNVLMNDATVYESYIKYPTDVKLLWDCTQWVYTRLFELYKQVRLRKPRCAYQKEHKKQKDFSKRKRKSHKLKNKRIGKLIALLEKGLVLLQEGINEYHKQKITNPFLNTSIDIKFYEKLRIIKEVLSQQKHMYSQQEKKIADRIVSLAKPWVRAIVRGKENKPAEFGAKVHISQTDGINYVEHYSNKAFNECKRLKRSILKHESLFKTKCTHYAADNIYPTNENRRFITGKNIYTNFPQKGRAAKKDEDQLGQVRTLLGKQRATVLEGSFGNEKLHYSLNKVKARLQETEMVWIYFAIMTANASKIASRREKQQYRQAA